jgi:hypothetical protein
MLLLRKKKAVPLLLRLSNHFDLRSLQRVQRIGIVRTAMLEVFVLLDQQIIRISPLGNNQNAVRVNNEIHFSGSQIQHMQGGGGSRVDRFARPHSGVGPDAEEIGQGRLQAKRQRHPWCRSLVAIEPRNRTVATRNSNAATSLASARHARAKSVLFRDFQICVWFSKAPTNLEGILRLK